MIKRLRLTMLFAFLSMTMFLTGCGVQAIPQSKNAVEATLSEVTNQYKRRADLVPSLVEAVKGFAKQESQVLTNVTEARARATQMTIDPSKVTADQLMEFQSRQAQLSQALGRLLAISENYPQLRSNENFRDLQAQLEGTENRIAIARQRHIEAVQNFNNMVTVPPYSWTNALFFHYEKMPQWDVSAEEKSTIEKPPEVKF